MSKILYDGKIFNSMSDAARKLKVAYTTIFYALKRGDFKKKPIKKYVVKNEKKDLSSNKKINFGESPLIKNPCVFQISSIDEGDNRK